MHNSNNLDDQRNAKSIHDFKKTFRTMIHRADDTTGLLKTYLYQNLLLTTHQKLLLYMYVYIRIYLNGWKSKIITSEVRRVLYLLTDLKCTPLISSSCIGGLKFSTANLDKSTGKRRCSYSEFNEQKQKRLLLFCTYFGIISADFC